MAKSHKDYEESESEVSDSDEDEEDEDIKDEDLEFGKLSKQDQLRVMKLVKLIAKQKHTLEK